MLHKALNSLVFISTVLFTFVWPPSTLRFTWFVTTMGQSKMTQFNCYWMTTTGHLAHWPPSDSVHLGPDYMSWAGPVSRVLGTSVKRNKNVLCDYMTTRPARLAEIPANRVGNLPCNRVYRASPANRDSKRICLRTNLLTCKLSIFSLNDKEVHKTM